MTVELFAVSLPTSKKKPKKAEFDVYIQGTREKTE